MFTVLAILIGLDIGFIITCLAKKLNKKYFYIALIILLGLMFTTADLILFVNR